MYQNLDVTELIGQVPGAGCCEHGTETSGTVKPGKFLHNRETVSQYGLCYMKKISYYLHERWSQTSMRQDGLVTSSEYKLENEPLLIEYLLETRRDIFSLWIPYSTNSSGNVPKQFSHLQWTIPDQRRRPYKVVTKL